MDQTPTPPIDGARLARRVVDLEASRDILAARLELIERKLGQPLPASVTILNQTFPVDIPAPLPKATQS